MITIIALLVFVAIMYFLFPLIEVVGDSMYATYKDGDILMGIKLFRVSKLKNGDVIVYKSPTDNKVVIKRIDHIVIDTEGNYSFFCIGDNYDYSYDSREYGLVSYKNLICKVIPQRRNKNE